MLSNWKEKHCEVTGILRTKVWRHVTRPMEGTLSPFDTLVLSPLVTKALSEPSYLNLTTGLRPDNQESKKPTKKEPTTRRKTIGKQ